MISNIDLLGLRSNIPLTQVQVLPKFFYEHEIFAIKRIAEQYPEEEASIISSNPSNSIIHRNSKLRWLAWNEEIWWIYSKIMERIKVLNEAIWKFELYGINEYIQYTEYQLSNGSRGHYDWHLDVSHEGITSNRKLTFECVLDDDFSGGDISLLMGPEEQRVPLGRGDAIIFPSYLMNKVYPVTSGQRKSIVCWVAGPSFR